MTVRQLATLQIPRWFLTLLAGAAAVTPVAYAAITKAYALGAAVEQHLQETHETFVQVCRIDFVLHMDVPSTCPVTTFRTHDAGKVR